MRAGKVQRQEESNFQNKSQRGTMGQTHRGEENTGGM